MHFIDNFSSDSSDDNLALDTSSEDELLLPFRRKPKNEDYMETITRYNDEEFRGHFRIIREVANNLIERFQNSEYYHHQSGEYGKIEPSKFVFVFLWFAGHQTSSFRDVSDRFDIALSTLFKIIRRMTYLLSNLSDQIIKWPSEEEKVEIEAHFPGVIGVIDGTHIRIDR